MGLSGLTYLVQGWVVGSEGFSQTMSIAIVLGWVLDLTWMIWLIVARSPGRRRWRTHRRHEHVIPLMSVIGS